MYKQNVLYCTNLPRMLSTCLKRLCWLTVSLSRFRKIPESVVCLVHVGNMHIHLNTWAYCINRPILTQILGETGKMGEVTKWHERTFSLFTKRKHNFTSVLLFVLNIRCIGLRLNITRVFLLTRCSSSSHSVWDKQVSQWYVGRKQNATLQWYYQSYLVWACRISPTPVTTKPEL